MPFAIRLGTTVRPKPPQRFLLGVLGRGDDCGPANASRSRSGAITDKLKREIDTFTFPGQETKLRAGNNQWQQPDHGGRGSPFQLVLLYLACPQSNARTTPVFVNELDALTLKRLPDPSNGGVFRS